MRRHLCNCLFIFFIGIGLLTISCNTKSKDSHPVNLEVKLGKKLFFDKTLSSPSGMSCSSCHSPETGWTGPDSKVNEVTGIYEGALEGRFGNRRPPTSAYAGFSPKFLKLSDNSFIGGLFWDGRATGSITGDPLADQAMGPFLNSLEHNIIDKKDFVEKLKKVDYVDLLKKVWGSDIFIEEKDHIFEKAARAIAVFERSKEVNPFSSKFDDFWKKANLKKMKVHEIDENNWTNYKGLGLVKEELQGLMLFNTQGLCSKCHVLTSEKGVPPLFTDFTYDNLGVPKNPNNPFYTMDEPWNPEGENWIDKGLGGFLEKSDSYKIYSAENLGKHKVPTLRNVDQKPNDRFIKSYFHNGFFKSLKDIVHFYNTRDHSEVHWPEPEVKSNLNTDEMGLLNLTDREEDLIVIFMKTLSDRKVNKKDKKKASRKKLDSLFKKIILL